MEVRLAGPSECTGCGACAAACQEQAIAMIANDEGFLVPLINHKRCAVCKHCSTICPVLHPETIPEGNPVAMAAVCTDELIRHRSSSGGIFHLLAEEILQQGGAVAGAAWDPDMKLRHRLIRTRDELAPLLGSKYVQSRMDDIYPDIQELLSKHVPVLFCGTPCQTAGLKAFLGGDSPGLVCVDLACHGVPSPGIWRQYVKELSQQYRSALRSFSFRDKSTGWRRYSVQAEFDGKDPVSVPHTQDPYMWLFLKAMTLRPVCYTCPYRGLRRISDLTLADLWGAEKMAPELDDDQGVSLVLIQTEKGKALWSKVANRVRYHPADLTLVVKSNPRLVQSPDRPVARKTCFSLVGKQPFSEIVQRVLNETHHPSSGWWNMLKRRLGTR